MIQLGSTVKVHYTGKYTNGDVFDTSSGKDPLQFQIGSGQIIPGFESALIGKNIGDSLTVNIQPENAYGQINEELLVKVPHNKMPGPVEIGQTLQAVADNNQPVQVIVKEVTEEYVLIDGNHPLAGEELVFDIEVVEVV
jgi:peptidylprolyl isomerase